MRCRGAHQPVTCGLTERRVPDRTSKPCSSVIRCPADPPSASAVIGRPVSPASETRPASSAAPIAAPGRQREPPVDRTGGCRGPDEDESPGDHHEQGTQAVHLKVSSCRAMMTSEAVHESGATAAGRPS